MNHFKQLVKLNVVVCAMFLLGIAKVGATNLPDENESGSSNKFVITASATSLCEVGSVTLTAEPLPGGTIIWLRNNKKYATGQSVTVENEQAVGRWIAIFQTDECEEHNRVSNTIELSFVPPQPNLIDGKRSVCANTTVLTYSVEDVAGVTYTWKLPPDWAIINGQGTHSITVTTGSVGGTITVTPSNTCGDGTARTLKVTMPPCKQNSFSNDVSKHVTITVDTTTLTILTYNLGANPSLTPKQQLAYSPSCPTDITVFGGWYQWGRSHIDHTFRCDPFPDVESDSRFTTTQVTSATADVTGEFIYNPVFEVYDWINPQDNTLWGNGSLNNPASGTNNPCPDGYRVPTLHEWDLLFKALIGNTILAFDDYYWVMVNNGIVSASFNSNYMCGMALYTKSDWDGSGLTIGSNLITANIEPLLFLPAAGWRTHHQNVAGDGISLYGTYWSSSVANSFVNYDSYYLVFGSTGSYTNSNNRIYGFSVRCVKE